MREFKRLIRERKCNTLCRDRKNWESGEKVERKKEWQSKQGGRKREWVREFKRLIRERKCKTLCRNRKNWDSCEKMGKRKKEWMSKKGERREWESEWGKSKDW